MNRKMIVSLFLCVNATVAIGIAQTHFHDQSATAAILDDGTQPPVPPKGPGSFALLDDGTQPPVPPKGPGVAILIADGTQPPVPPKGPGATVAMMDGTQPPVPPKGPGVRAYEVVSGDTMRLSVSPQAENSARLAALTADGTQPPVPPKGPGATAQRMSA